MQRSSLVGRVGRASLFLSLGFLMFGVFRGFFKGSYKDYCKGSMRVLLGVWGLGLFGSGFGIWRLELAVWTFRDMQLRV